MKILYLHNHKNFDRIHDFIQKCISRLSTQFEVAEYKFTARFDYDIDVVDILILFGVSPKVYRRVSTNHPIVIYFGLLSDFYKNGFDYLQYVNECYVINDTLTSYPERIISRDIGTVVNPIFIFDHFRPKSIEKHCVLIVFTCLMPYPNESLLGISQFVNHLANRFGKEILITVLTNQPKAGNFLNDDINIVYKSKVSEFNNELLTLVKDADSYYGSGLDTTVALLHCPNVFVLGPRGYGGRLNSENFLHHLKTSFLGRLGGEIGEHIPTSLMVKEFTANLSRSAKFANMHTAEKAFYLEVHEEILRSISHQINYAFEIASYIDHQFVKCSMKISPLFSLHENNEGVLVRNKLTNKIDLFLEGDFFKLLLKYGGGFSVSDLQTKILEDVDLNEIFRDLYYRNIIVALDETISN
jgi:hypothetical protein